MKSLDRLTPSGARALRQRLEKYPSALRGADADLMWQALVIKSPEPHKRWSKYSIGLHLLKIPQCTCVKCVKCNDGRG